MITRKITNVAHMIKQADTTGMDIEIRGVSIDSRTVKEGNLYIPIIGPNSNGHDYIDGAIENGAVATLWKKNEPHPPKNIPVVFVNDTLIALQQLASSYREELHGATFIGITGSNGKTSTKDMLYHVLRTKFKTEKTMGNLNNHIGVPLTLLSLDEHVEMAVIEMGMDHPLEISFLTKMVKPDVAVITNIGSAHLATMGSLQAIAKAKMEIVQGLPADGCLVLNGDHDLLMQESAVFKGETYTFGEQQTNELYMTSFHQDVHTLTFTATGRDTRYVLPLIGGHQAINGLAVIQVACKIGLSEEDIREGFSQVELSEQRNEIKQLGHVTIINDTYKSNPESVQASIRSLKSIPDDKQKICIFGDMVDMGDQAVFLHEQIGAYIAEAGIDVVLGIGEFTSYTIHAINNAQTGCQAHLFQEEADLIETVIDLAKNPCTILIKASRSLQFEKIVHAIEERIRQ